MGFEKFEESGSGRGRPAGTDPMISLRKSGSIGINKAALDEFVGDSGGAIMYYDADASRIGIELVADKDEDEAAYSITKSDSGGTIAPKAFLRKYDLIPDVTTQYEPTEEDGMVVLDLDEPIGTHGSADDGDGSETTDDD
ncbi:hypothetical protein JCM17823_10900 [Halorubrum gandharaense]